VDVSERSNLKRKRTLSRQEAAGWLSILAQALTAGATIEVDLAGERVSLQPADEIRTEIELKSRPDKQEIEIELAWSPTPASEATVAAGE
jgi:amphi-Trp domain-containing protein